MKSPVNRHARSQVLTFQCRFVGVTKNFREGNQGFVISNWRQTARTLPLAGFFQIAWFSPSRTITQP